MTAALPRLLLLFLLGVDWAADPSLLAPVLQPFARAQASTENVCPSIAYREAVRKESAPAPQASPTPRPLEALAPRPLPARRKTAGTGSGPDLVYRFLSIRR